MERPENFGGAWLLVGFGEAALRKKLDGAARSLMNRLQWAGNAAGYKAVESVINQYENGLFLSHE